MGRKSMKKIIALLTALLLILFSLCACGPEEVDPDFNVGPDGENNFPIVDVPTN